MYHHHMMRLTVYMFQVGTKPGDAVDLTKVEEKGYQALENIKLKDTYIYVQSTSPKEPKWVSFISSISEKALPKILTNSASAVIVVKAQDRVFAVPFGFGRGILNLDRLEPNFGLKVALNSIDSSKLRSVDKKNYEDMVVSSSISLSSQSNLSSFNIDTYSDILRQVTGTPTDDGFATRVTGADALTVNKEISAADLPSFCTQLEKVFKLEDYKKNFAWIDNLQIVRSKQTVQKLNELLLEELKTGQPSRSHLALPENINWQDIDHFRVDGAGARQFVELDLTEILDAMGPKLDELTVDKLKSRKVGVTYSRTSGVDQRWTFYRCLVSEQEIGECLYALIEGSWFQIQKTLVDEVNTFTDSLKESGTLMPEHRHGEAEIDYNNRLASSSDDLLLLDRVTGAIPGESGTVELCDVLSSSGELIHVKRKSRSASLSHLFSQGLVSASVLLSDRNFRRAMRQKVEVAAEYTDPAPWLALIPEDDEDLEPSKYCVTYAIVPTNSFSDHRWLPFFSKLSLMNQAKALRLMGLDVALKRIPSERYN